MPNKRGDNTEADFAKVRAMPQDGQIQYWLSYQRWTKLQREEVKKLLASILYDSMFGDGLEGEYIWDGINFKGLNNMTDEELRRELDQYQADEDETEISSHA